MARTWQATHIADGVPVMLTPEDTWTEDELTADDDRPRRFIGSYGAYSADEWINDGAWPRVRLLADGFWVRARADGPGWEDITQSVTAAVSLAEKITQHGWPVGVAEIADYLGYPAQTVKQWRTRGVLPAPAGELSGVPFWWLGDVLAWAAKTGRNTRR